jgi:osmoprotectant transport system ATP-binding protein
MTGASIEFVNAGYSLPGGRALVSNLNLSVPPGETLVLVGMSGSGKTTTLKLINRLLRASAGEVRVQGKSVEQWDVIELRRHIGYAIQDVGLFPHYTVSQNVALVPKIEQWEASRIAARVEEVLELVGLPAREFATRYPHELSGGQRQRVGLARAIAAEPPILLMDEPFGALDPITRAEVRKQFQELQRRLGKTIVFVTHDVGEALALGHRIGLMSDGKLRGVYTPDEFLKSDDDVLRAYVGVLRDTQRIGNGLPSDPPFRPTEGRKDGAPSC